MSWFSKFILKLLGWKLNTQIPENLKKAVVTMAPHTSYHDFWYGRLGFSAYKIKGKFMIKKESFSFPFGGILKALGGIPVDRSNSKSAIQSVEKAFAEREELFLVVTPEGTRKRVNKWKKGFYHIALNANVPIVLGYLDYKNKTGGFGPIMYPSGDFEADFKVIEDFYRDKTAKHPERFNLSS